MRVVAREPHPFRAARDGVEHSRELRVVVPQQELRPLAERREDRSGWASRAARCMTTRACPYRPHERRWRRG